MVVRMINELTENFNNEIASIKKDIETIKKDHSYAEYNI